jgi:competence protein ComEC
MPSRSSWRTILALLTLAFFTVLSVFFYSDDTRLSVSFFDVGQGDGILLKKGNFEVLVDGGPDETILSHLGKILPPWDRLIEIVIITHPHADHIAGLVEVLQKYEIGEIWGTGVAHESQIYLSLQKIIEEDQIPFRIVTSSYRLENEGLILRVLYPLQNVSGQRMQNLNLSSILLKVTYGQLDLLLTGDAEEPVQQELVKQGFDEQAEVIKIPHQGSRDADLPAFLKTVNPQIAILSVGEKNRYGHPHPEVIDRYSALGASLFRTDRDGTITVTSNGSEFWIRTSKTGIMARVELIQ